MAYDGTLQFDAKMDTSGFQSGANKLTSIVKSSGAFKLLESGFRSVTNSVDAAVARYDTLERFPRILEQMGFSAEDAGAATSKLSDGIQGLPTTLDDVVSTAQRLTVLTGNLDMATDTTLALNNAFLASGSTSADASRGLQQYVQMLSSGKVDMQSWRTLQETMGYALNETAKAFGFAGTSAQNDLYAALQSGEITFDSFNAKLVELDGSVGGFAELAKTATGGIGTAWTNLQTGIVRGTTSIVEAIDEGLSTTRFKSIENIISAAGRGINKVLQSVAKAAGFVIENFAPLTAGVVTFGVAVKGVQLLSMIGQMGSITAAAKAMLPAIVANTAARIKNIAASISEQAIQAKTTVAKWLQTAAIIAGTTANRLDIAVKNKSVAATVAQSAALGTAAIAQKLLNAVQAASPVGLVIAGVVALTAAVVGLVAWLNSSSEAYQKQKSEVDALSYKQKSLADSLKESETAFADNMSSVGANAQAGENLLGTLEKLIAANDHTAASHEAITQAVNDLNGAYDGLNLAYDEETEALSASVEEVKKYIENKNTLSKMSALDERRIELAKKQAEIEAALNEIAAKRKIILADDNLSTWEKNKLLKELDKATKEYNETQNDLALDVKANNAAIEESTDSMAQNSVNRYEAINGTVTTEGQNLKQLAHQYGTTTEQILADMEAQGISMEEWAARKAEGFTAEGLSLDDIAAKWGMTTDEVKAYMDEWGLSLDDFNTEMEDTHTSAGLTLDDLALKWGTTTDEIKRQLAEQGISMQEWSDNQDARTQDVINSFQEIPAEYDKSADDLINILQKNAERYSQWSENMAILSQTMSADAIAELEKLGPAANSAIEEMIADPSKAQAFEQSVADTVKAGAGRAVTASSDPRFAEAGGQAEANIGGGVTASQETEAAMTAKISSAADAANAAVDGGALDGIGENIALKIVNGVSSSDMSGISKSLGQAVTNGAAAVNTALGAMKIQMATQFSDMCTAARNNVAQMMSLFVAEINGKRSAAQAAAKSVTEAVTNALKELIEKGRAVADKAMEAFVAGIKAVTPLAKAIAKTLISSVKSAATEAVTTNNFANIGLQIINGITQGVINGTSGLVNAMVSAVEQAAQAAKSKAKINSPSKLFRDLIGLGIMEGWAQGIEKGQPLVNQGMEGAVDAAERTALGALFSMPNAQMQGIVARMQAGVEARHAATAAQVTVPRIAAAAMGGVVELSDGSISALRGRGQQSVGAINLTVKTLLDGEKVYESVQRVGLERGMQITSGRFDYVR